ncbi:MAG TPA: hypothetical protein ENK04_08755 [Gammaproteobacteria bacterium]|nr:hypothetical protein [Gammaproteobacteria bacterium]
MATRHLGEAIALGDSHSSTHYLLTAALWHEQDCDFVKTADDYVRLCANNRKCKSENVEWAVNRVWIMPSQKVSVRRSQKLKNHLVKNNWRDTPDNRGFVKER